MSRETIQHSERRPPGIRQLVAVGLDSGIGHIKEAIGVANGLTLLGVQAKFAELNSLIRPYASEAEAEIIRQLDRYNRVALTEIAARIIPPLGQHVVNRLAEQLPARNPPLWNLEQKLAPAFTRALMSLKTEALVTTHPAIARIALLAKSKGFLDYNFPVISSACDYLENAAPIVRQIYNHLPSPLDASTIGINNLILVASARARDAFVAWGHPAEMIQVINVYKGLSVVEAALVGQKRERLKTICARGGLSSELPLVVSFIPDNFESRDENNAAFSLARNYAPELIDRRLVFLFMLTEQDEQWLRAGLKKFNIPEHQMQTLETAEQLELFFTLLETNQDTSIVFMRKKSTDFNEFVKSQDALLLNSNLTVCRPSELPGEAVSFRTPMMLTTPMSPVEKQIKTFRFGEGTSLPWSAVDRGTVSAMQRRILRIPFHDLTDPKTHQLLLQMQETAAQSSVRRPLTGLVSAISEILKLS